MLTKGNEVVKYDLKSILEVFKMFFANMAGTLLEKVQHPPNKYDIDSVNNRFSTTFKGWWNHFK